MSEGFTSGSTVVEPNYSESPLSHGALLSPWEERFCLRFQTDLKAETVYGELTNGCSLEPDECCLLPS